jgi:glycosyltransferase involved in cell wall biosynthesis
MKILFGKKVIIKIANTDLDSDFLQLTTMRCGAWIVRFLQRADCLVALCQRSVEEARENGFAEACTRRIPNGVDTMRFMPTGPYPGLRDRIVCVGRLTRIKGIDVLLEAFGQLRREGSGLRLDIYGDGPEKERLMMAADDLGLAGAVVFHGQIGTVEAVFEHARVLVQPSLAEGMSNVILEAMAAGLPVVATRTGAAGDIIRDGVSGLLIDPGSARQIHDAVQRLLCDESLAESIGRQARAAVEAAYSIERVAGNYLELYQGLLDPPAVSRGRERIV